MIGVPSNIFLVCPGPILTEATYRHAKSVNMDVEDIKKEMVCIHLHSCETLYCQFTRTVFSILSGGILLSR